MPRSNVIPPCPSDAELVELVEGRLAQPALVRLKDHVAGCSACAGFLDGLASGERGGMAPASSRLDVGVARAIVESPTTPHSGERDVTAPVRVRGEILGRGAPVGRYLVLSLIGRGGMGEVYAAYDPELDRRVALKLLHTARGADHARRRLTREARALGKLSHPHVVQVYDVGEHEGDVFVAMELIEGQPLDAWCAGPPRPGWQEVLAAYLDAARGLAAAHAKGIVHRDVKPSNVLRGKDGRVRVADFGLAAGQPAETADHGGAGEPELSESVSGEAAPFDETIPALSDSHGDRDDRLTATGALLGTPLYMAPEQFEGPGVGPASDQHSLCTALHQGLYGALPFSVSPGPARLIQLVARKKEGPPASPPAGSPVPPWVYRALARGLASRPEDRFPSMEALVEALREPPEARRRPRLRNAAIGVAAVIVAAFVAVRSGALVSPCAHPERQLAGAWDEGVEGRVRAALLGTGRTYAGDIAGRVAAILDRYAASWASMRGEVCETSRSGGQRREVVTLRDQCLDRRLGQIKALSALLAEKPDVQVLDKAVQAAAALPPLASCADVEALTARVRPPEDPALRARVAALQPRVDRLEALHEAGKYQEGVPLGEALLAEVGAVAYPPLRAQAQYWMGALRDGTGDYEAAKALLRDAAVSAGEGRDDVLAAASWAQLLGVVGDRQQRFEEASLIRALGPAVVRARDERTQASWLSAEGSVLYRMGKYPEAKGVFEQARDLREKVLGPLHPDLAVSLNALGNTLNSMADYRSAAAAHERALVIWEKALGPDHPEVAAALNGLGNVLYNLGDYPRCKAMHERALAVWEKALGPDHPLVAAALNGLGLALSGLGDYPRARAVFERTVAIREKALGPDHPEVAAVLSNLGSVLLASGAYPEALAANERAVAIYEKVLGPDHPRVAAGLTNLGNALSMVGDYRRARAVLERALAIREKTLGAAHPEVAAALLNTGSMIVATGDYPQAQALFERALAIWEKALGPDHPNLGFALVNLGGTLFEAGDYRLAAARFERALALREKALGPDHPRVAAPLAGLGRARVRLGQLDAALPVLTRALAIREKAGPSHPEVAEPLLGLGELALARRKPDEAVLLLERAVTLHDAEVEPAIQLALAEALWQSGKDRRRARALVDLARARYERLGHRPGQDRIARWLADHPR